jgi:hypothetical protein
MKANTPHISTHEPPYTDINMSHIQVGGGVMGLLFAAGTAYIFVAGIPTVRWFFFGAIAAGFGISIALRLFHKYKPVRPFTSIAS